MNVQRTSRGKIAQTGSVQPEHPRKNLLASMKKDRFQGYCADILKSSSTLRGITEAIADLKDYPAIMAYLVAYRDRITLEYLKAEDVISDRDDVRDHLREPLPLTTLVTALATGGIIEDAARSSITSSIASPLDYIEKRLDDPRFRKSFEKILRQEKRFAELTPTQRRLFTSLDKPDHVLSAGYTRNILKWGRWLLTDPTVVTRTVFGGEELAMHALSMLPASEPFAIIPLEVFTRLESLQKAAPAEPAPARREAVETLWEILEHLEGLEHAGTALTPEVMTYRDQLLTLTQWNLDALESEPTPSPAPKADRQEPLQEEKPREDTTADIQGPFLRAPKRMSRGEGKLLFEHSPTLRQIAKQRLENRELLFALLAHRATIALESVRAKGLLPQQSSSFQNAEDYFSLIALISALTAAGKIDENRSFALRTGEANELQYILEHWMTVLPECQRLKEAGYTANPLEAVRRNLFPQRRQPERHLSDPYIERIVQFAMQLIDDPRFQNYLSQHADALENSLQEVQAGAPAATPTETIDEEEDLEEQTEIVSPPSRAAFTSPLISIIGKEEALWLYEHSPTLQGIDPESASNEEIFRSLLALRDRIAVEYAKAKGDLPTHAYHMPNAENHFSLNVLMRALVLGKQIEKRRADILRSYGGTQLQSALNARSSLEPVLAALRRKGITTGLHRHVDPHLLSRRDGTTDILLSPRYQESTLNWARWLFTDPEISVRSIYEAQELAFAALFPHFYTGDLVPEPIVARLEAAGNDAVKRPQQARKAAVLALWDLMEHLWQEPENSGTGQYLKWLKRLIEWNSDAIDTRSEIPPAPPAPEHSPPPGAKARPAEESVPASAGALSAELDPVAAPSEALNVQTPRRQPADAPALNEEWAGLLHRSKLLRAQLASTDPQAALSLFHSSPTLRAIGDIADNQAMLCALLERRDRIAVENFQSEGKLTADAFLFPHAEEHFSLAPLLAALIAGKKLEEEQALGMLALAQEGKLPTDLAVRSIYRADEMAFAALFPHYVTGTLVPPYVEYGLMSAGELAEVDPAGARSMALQSLKHIAPALALREDVDAATKAAYLSQIEKLIEWNADEVMTPTGGGTNTGGEAGPPRNAPSSPADGVSGAPAHGAAPLPSQASTIIPPPMTQGSSAAVISGTGMFQTILFPSPATFPIPHR